MSTKRQINRHGEPRCPVCPHFLNSDGAEGWICNKRGGCESEFDAEAFEQGCDHAWRPGGDPHTGAKFDICIVCAARRTARPFQPGDSVRITDHNRRMVAPNFQYVYEGVVSRIDPAAAPESGHDFGPYLWIDTEQFVAPGGDTYTATFCPLTDDMTAAADVTGRAIELLEPVTPNHPEEGTP